jgi:(4-O-methyl)-D-glucuronate---lignin esterase
VWLLAAVLLAVAVACRARPASRVLAPPAHLTAEQSHQRMMDLLHIKSLRPGADSHHPDSPNAVNYDESKANSHPHLPDPLILNDGKRVTSAAEWWKERRPQIVQDFNEDIYGRVPRKVPAVKWEVLSTVREKNGEVPVMTKLLIGHVDNSSYPPVSVNIQVTLTTPANAAGPVPVIIELALDPAFLRKLRAIMAKRGVQFPAPPHGLTWQQQVLARGWGYATYIPTSVQPDNGAGLTEGIVGLCNKGQPRDPDDWGALRAWAWGASRLLDYFETDTAVNAKQVGIMGHSRYGKASLVAMAYDKRFAIGYISSSGMGGGGLYRRHFGELLENVAATNEFHWMAGNFLKYAGPLTANDLPVDSHELIALCAPRPVFIGAGEIHGGDGWLDPRGMFMSEVAAGPVYSLVGAKGLPTSHFPPLGTSLLSGDLAYRQHHGGHIPGPDWPYFLEFGARYLKAPGTKAH